MKNIIFLVTCVFFLGVPDANGYKNAIKVQNRSVYNKCFDSFNPIINPMTNVLKRDSRWCIIQANAQKKKDQALLQNSRLELLEEMQRFKESMKNCSAIADHSRYSECLSNVIRIDRDIVEGISSRFDSSTERERQIESEKQECLRRAVNRSKEMSAEALKSLENCLSVVNNLL